MRSLLGRPRFDDRFAPLADANGVGVFTATNGVIREANDAFLALLQRTREDLESGRLTAELLGGSPFDDGGREHPTTDWPRRARYEIDHPLADGSHLRLFVAVAEFEPGVHGGLVLDCSTPPSADATQRRSDARFRAAAEGFDAFVIFDAVRDARGRIVDFRYADLNSHAVKRLGRSSREEILGKKLSDVLPPTHVQPYIAKYAQVVDTRRAVEEETHLDVPGLMPRWVALHIVPLAGGVAVTSRDISQRRADEEERKALLAFLDSILENVPATIFVKDAATLRFERLNRFCDELFGFERGAAIGKTNHEVFPKATADAFEASDREVLAKGQASTLEIALQTKKGERWFQSQKLPLYDHHGVARRLLGVSIDITDHKRAEESLRGFEILFRHSPLGILISSPDGSSSTPTKPRCASSATRAKSSSGGRAARLASSLPKSGRRRSSRCARTDSSATSS